MASRADPIARCSATALYSKVYYIISKVTLASPWLDLLYSHPLPSCSMSFGSLPKTISVHLASPAFCPGEALDGEVHLQFPAVLDDRFKEIHIKLHGSINVYVSL